MVRVTDMTHGRPIRLILLFSLPLMLGSVFQQLYTIVDTIIIGRGGLDQLAGFMGTAGLYAGLCDSRGAGVRRGRIRPAASCTGYDR